jgi:glucan phosphorylase
MRRPAADNAAIATNPVQASHEDQSKSKLEIAVITGFGGSVLLTEHLVQGVDVWLNTPRRPWEACGTSGMKVLVNGGLNLSELDGWWAEA